MSFGVVHLHHGDNPGWGGGVVAMQRLHGALLEAGIESTILCGVKSQASPRTVQIPRWRLLEAGLKRVGRPLGFNDLHGVSAFGVRRHPAYRAADIVHIQGLHGGFFNYLALPALTRDKPVVYTLHDMWAFTGHCAYSYGCERWRHGCGRCPHLDAPPPVARDATAVEWRLKGWTYARARLTVVTVSRWLTALAQQSLLGRFPVRLIPNGVDVETYRPLGREECRRVLGLPRSAPVLLWLSTRMDTAHPEGFRKGGDLLLGALRTLPGALKRDLLVVLTGLDADAVTDTAGVRAVNLGFVGSDRLKAIVYGAADVFVHPTRADNAPLVLLESMACGTPMLSFRVGGVPELVREGETGLLAEPEDVESLRAGLMRLLDDAGLRQRLGERGRAVATAEYSLARHVRRHIALYETLLRSGGPPGPEPADGGDDGRPVAGVHGPERDGRGEKRGQGGDGPDDQDARAAVPARDAG